MFIHVIEENNDVYIEARYCVKEHPDTEGVAVYRVFSDNGVLSLECIRRNGAPTQKGMDYFACEDDHCTHPVMLVEL